MLNPLTAHAPASLLALVTTFHAALLVVRHARGASPRALLPLVLLASAGLSATPWLYPTVAHVWLGLLAHVAWFGLWELGLARPAVATAAGASTATLPAAVVPTPRATTAPRPHTAPGFTRLPVAAAFDETATIKTFRLVRPEGLTFSAGQFLPVQVQIDGRPHVRCYSISSAPEASGYIEISVRRQGLVSGALHASVRAGSTLQVRSPAGHFVYPQGDDRPVVLIGGGVGVTPLMSMLRHAVLSEPTRAVVMMLSVRTIDEIPYRDELDWLPRRHAHARVIVTLSGSDPGHRLRRGRVTAALIAEHVATPPDALYYLCGPLPMVREVSAMLETLGVPAGQIRSEAFEAARAIGAAPEAVAVAVAVGDDQPQACSRLTLARSRRTVDVPAGATLLDAAEAAGVDMPSLCRTGVCGTCRTRLVEGRARCTSDTLSAADKARGFVLPCVTWAESDCSLDA